MAVATFLTLYVTEPPTLRQTSVTATVTPSDFKIFAGAAAVVLTRASPLTKLVSQADKVYTLMLSGTVIVFANTTAIVVSLTRVTIEPVGAFHIYPVAFATALILNVSATPVVANADCVNKHALVLAATVVGIKLW